MKMGGFHCHVISVQSARLQPLDYSEDIKKIVNCIFTKRHLKLSFNGTPDIVSI